MWFSVIPADCKGQITAVKLLCTNTRCIISWSTLLRQQRHRDCWVLFMSPPKHGWGLTTGRTSYYGFGKNVPWFLNCAHRSNSFALPNNITVLRMFRSELKVDGEKWWKKNSAVFIISMPHNIDNVLAISNKWMHVFIMFLLNSPCQADFRGQGCREHKGTMK